jgi:NAD(P)-dependent dehydrogenase (short-subunit alcohol dehydrogenase family)
VAVVTGGGGGIGTAVALELARQGVAVVAMDPGVGVQGEPLAEPTAAQTAQLITEAGGVARASTASVTDRAAVRSLFAGVVAEFGGLDIVVNTAGILRFAPFAQASEDDWRAVLGVHLDGYLNVLAEALPLMEAAGYGRIVGVTSGAGLARAAGDNASYACAKRAIAAVTWQLAGLLPGGVALNALSPIAATRMVTGALTRAAAPARPEGGPGGRPGGRPDDGPGTGAAAAPPGGGLDLSSMPTAEDMGPAGAYLAGEQAGSLRGQIVFSAGPELSVISPPRLIEAIRTERAADFAASLDTLVPVVLAPAEGGQRSTGGANARFGPVFDQPGTAGPAADEESEPRYCLIACGHPDIARALAPAVARCGLTAIDVAGRPASAWPASGAPEPLPAGFDAVEAAVQRAARITEHLDAVVIAPGSFAGPGTEPGAAASWAGLLDGYSAVTEEVLAHAGWLQAAGRQAIRSARPLRIVHLADATAPAHLPAAQAVAQLARCATLAQPGLIDVFSVALGTARPADLDPVAQLAARLLWAGDATALRGAELLAQPGWIGLRSHPEPLATLCFGTPDLPSWVGDWLAQAVATAPGTAVLPKLASRRSAPAPRPDLPPSARPVDYFETMGEPSGWPARRMRLRRAAGGWTIGGPPQPAALVRRDEW